MLDLKSLNGVNEFHRYSKGEIIFSPTNHEKGRLYLLMSGKAIALDNPSAPYPKQIFIKKAGEYFGEELFFNNIIPPYTIIAMEDCVVAHSDKEYVLSFFMQNPNIFYEFLVSLYNRVPRTEEYDPNLHTDSKKELPTPSIPAKESITEETLEQCTSLFPDGHKMYNVTYPTTHDQFLITIQFDCPNCKSKFDVLWERTSLLRLKNAVGCDLRKEYIDYVSEWHEVVTCPHCLFSSLSSNWKDYSNIREPLKATLIELSEDISVDLTAISNINSVFTAYYLALLCAPAYKTHLQIVARLWKNLAYLYEEVGDSEMVLYSKKKAYESYKDYYVNSDVSQKVNQTLCMVLGTLAKENGFLEDAYHFLYEAKINKTGMALYERMIDDELYEVKKLRKKEKDL